MKHPILALIILISLFTLKSNAQNMNLHSFTVEDINGDEYDLSQLKGKKVLVVNTASECGLTPQYETLEEVYQQYGGDEFTIIGFPANNFGGQEPGSDEEIKQFCQKNYGVSFPMMSKISVKGSDQHELYQWLTQKSKNGVEDAKVSWNFQKFMIDENGNYVSMVSPKESPDCDKIVNWIKE
jgi:glutathione peroxidase